MKIERARKQDFAEMMDFMLRAYRTVNPKHDRFEELFPDLYRPSTDAMKRNYVIRTEGRMASMAGLFPIAIKLGAVRLSVAGVGGVCTDPRHRGKGGMTALMNRISDDIRKEGYPLAWLTGDRDRYARFGWEKAGSEIIVRLQQSRPDERAIPWKISGLNPDRDSLEAIFSARDGSEIKGLCDDEAFRLKLQRKNHRTWQASRENSFAYVVVNYSVRWVVEWGGDVEGVRALLNHAVGRHGVLHARLPALRDCYSPMWFSLAQQYGGPADNLAIFDLPGLLKSYKPYLRDIWPSGRSVGLTATDGEQTSMTAGIADGQPQSRVPRGAFSVRLSRLQMVSFLFGPQAPSFLLDLPREERWLDQVFPLPFTMPALWRL